jgi:undecaprenyl-diphosphatase
VSPIYHMTYLQAIAIGLVQGLTELFPVSSLGHTVLVPSWIGGTWSTLVRQESQPESPYLAFIVGLHLATALVLIGYYWRAWLRILGGLVTSIRHLRIRTADERLAWLLIIATIPVGIAGLALEHTFRVLFAKPLAAAVFLTINGGILIVGERYRRRDARLTAAARLEPATAAVTGGQSGRAATTAGLARAAQLPQTASRPDSADPAAARAVARSAGAGLARGEPAPAASQPGQPDVARTEMGEAEVGAADPGGAEPGTAGAGTAGAGTAGHRRDTRDEAAGLAADRRLSLLGAASALWIGASQILALLAGISREGVTMAGGLIRGLGHEDAMRFSFLLSTPVILAAGALKIPDLTGPHGNGLHGQVLAGSVAAAGTSLFAVVFLARWFRTRTLTPFAIYCLAAGLISIIRFGLF